MKPRAPRTAATNRPPAYIEIPMPTCPDCNGIDLEGKGTLPPNGDGSTSRYYHCRGCGRRLIVTRVPQNVPESGIEASGLPYTSPS